jgi:hypothetical protein
MPKNHERNASPNRALAEKIAQRLFVNGCQETAQRLVLTVDTPISRDLGGWSISAAIDHITKVLDREHLA